MRLKHKRTELKSKNDDRDQKEVFQVQLAQFM